MSDSKKTKKQLIEELEELRQQVVELKNGSGEELNRDVTERKLAEEALRKSEERYRAIAEDTPVMICRSKPGGEITYVNEAYCKYFAKTSEDLVGQTFLSLIPEADRETVMADISTLSIDSPTRSIEHQVIAPGGTIRWQRWSNRALFDLEGEIVAYQSVGEDITDRKASEEALRESEERYDEIVSSMPGVVYQFVRNTQGQFSIPYMSDAVQRIVGIRPDILIQDARKTFDFVHPDDHKGFLISIEESARSMTMWGHEFRVITPDKRTLWLKGSSNPSLLDDGGILWNGVLLDITERKQAERLLLAQHDLTQELSATTGLDMTLRICLEVAIELSGMDCGGIYLFDKTSELLKLVTSKGLSPEFVEVSSTYEPGSLSYDLVMAGNMFCARYEELKASEDEIRKREGLRAIAIVPVRYEDQVIACINIASHSLDEIHTTTRKILATIAAQIGSFVARAQTEEALRESEERFRSLFENAPLGYQSLDANGDFIELNETWCRLLGYTKEEVLGRNFSEFIHPDFREHFKENFPRFKSMGYILGVEFEMIKKDGSEIIVSFDGRIGHKEDGSFRQTHCVLSDITERKQAEEALRESMIRYEQLFSGMIDGFALHEIICDESGKPVDYRFLAINPAFERLTGLKVADFIGKRAYEAIPGLEPIWLEKYGQVALTGEAIHFEEYSAPLDKHFEVTAYRPAAGQFACIFVDITERKQAEEALRESEEKFRSITERIYDVIIAARLDGVISYVSPSVRRILGYMPEELVGRNMMEFVPEAEIPRAIETFQLSAAGEDVEGHHSEFLKKDGSYAVVELNARPIYKDGKVTGAQAVIRDITETRRLQELESRAERLEMAGTVAGQVAHDFNNLLAPLMAYPEFIREELPRNHPTLKYLDQIEKASQKIADINQDLLAMGRRGHYNQEVLNLNTVIQHALTELEPHPQTLACEIDLSDDLMDILGGGAQIHRMVSNLLHNARDAMQDIGQITVKTENYYVDDVSVAYGKVPKGEYVKLTISDTGCGIPDDIVQKIFDPFFTSKTTDKKRGSGLGMSVVDAVIKDHNGHIDLSTTVGEGTSFYIYFPITRKAVDGRDSDSALGGSETILIVDDDDIQREVSSQLMKKLGYKVNTVESGEKAIAFLRENPRDLVILDMVMPGGIDGAETYRRMLEISPHQKTIILSGFSESDRVIEAQKLGVGAFVRKPVTRVAIAAAVRSELDRETRVNSR